MTDEQKQERIEDSVLIEWLKKFYSNPKTEFENKARDYIDYLEKILKKPKFTKKYQSVKEKIPAEISSELNKEFSKLNMTDEGLDFFCALLLSVVRYNPRLKEEISAFISDKLSSETGPVISKLELINQGISQ